MIEVRCCCQPQKLLGWFGGEVPAGARQITFPLAPEMPRAVFHDQYPGRMPLGELTLPVALIDVPGQGRYLAVKAEGVPIETLRRCPGFREALQI